MFNNRPDLGIILQKNSWTLRPAINNKMFSSSFIFFNEFIMLW